MPRHQNAGQTHDTDTANKSTETVSKFTQLGITVTNENSDLKVTNVVSEWIFWLCFQNFYY